MVDEDLVPTEDELLSEIARSIVAEKPPQPDRADGWRTFTDLLEETGLTEPVLRDVLNKGVKAGKFEVVRCTPHFYRVKKGE